MTVSSRHNGLIMPSLVWLAALAAAFLGAYLKGLDINAIWPMAAIASVPALISLLFSPILRREWAQLIVIFAWLSLAIVACISIAYIPMAVLFLCAPAAAALFEKEKVVEAMVMAAIFAALLWYAGQQGYIPESLTSETQTLWGKQAGLIATIGLMITTMFAAARSKNASIAETPALPPHLSVESEALLNAIDGAALRFDGHNRLVSSNIQASQLFGFAQGLSQMPLGSLMSHDSETQKNIEDLIAQARLTQRSQNKRLQTRFDTDTLSFLDAVATPINPSEVLLHLRDVTSEENRVESILRSNASVQQDKDDMTLFFAGVSHELRTPLNAIIGFSDMMRSRLFGPLPGKYAEYADLIHDSGQHMLDLIGDVLDLSKVEAGKYELHYDHFDAADVIRSSVKMIRPAADQAEVVLSVGIDDNDPLLLEADRKALRQILLNLLSNAIKFSHKGGHVIVAAKIAGDTLSLSVQDKGVGMSAEDVASLGQPYQQAASAAMVEDRGTGLGFALVKSLAELHGGRFAVASQLGEGTTVDIFLPVERAAP
ncbi:sensor histidine kinase [Hellea balneolensis]|uniref:sensor histidine kinase n=1 Tax=Hellea balneolensis TaxID=287478 RepID=UPI000407C093|nr:HAMP domain-containing sensor histidine kinase [Hellea balneolensis]